MKINSLNFKAYCFIVHVSEFVYEVFTQRYIFVGQCNFHNPPIEKPGQHCK